VATSVDERALRLIGEHRAVESAAAEAEGIRVALHPDVEGGLLAAGGQLGDRVLHRDPAAIHDRDLADRLHLVEQVRRKEHGPAFRDEAPDHVAELANPGRVEPVRRLVQD